MIKRLRHQPFFLLSLAVLMGIGVVFCAAFFSMQQPSLGIQFQAGTDFPGALVVSVRPDGPAATILLKNDVIIKVQTPNGQALRLTAADLAPDPDIFSTFGGYNTFLGRQKILAKMLLSPLLLLDLEDGRTVQVQPSVRRPLASLPLEFWRLNLIGLIAFLIGFAVSIARSGNVAARMLFGTGTAMLILAATSSVITCRELALLPQQHRLLQAIYHAGNDFFSIFGISLLYYYPRRLFRTPILPFLFFLALSFWLNERFQWIDLPGHSILFQVPIYFLLGGIIAVFQWWKSRNRPADRTAFRWFLLSLFGCVGFALTLYFLPMMTTGHAVVPLSAGLGGVLLMYFGLTLGVLRYRLFDLDRWWFDLWLWFLAGSCLLVVDVFFVFIVSITRPVSLVLSLLFVGWFYFPVRQWLWTRAFRSSRRRAEKMLPELVAGLLSSREHRNEKALEWALNDVFQPLLLEKDERITAKTIIINDGEALLVPTLGAQESFRLGCVDRGARLFSANDAHLADALFALVKRTEDHLTAYDRGVDEERERIMRDLHDDVGGRLLTLIHASPSHHMSTLARDALKSLRDIIYSLNPEEKMPLGEALGKWRYECRQRCELADVQLDWRTSSVTTDIMLSPRQWVNLSRAFYEIVTNAFSHAQAEHILVTWRLKNRELTGSIQNDGQMPDSHKQKFGKGIQNMEVRLKEISGSCVHRVDQAAGIYEVVVWAPLAEQTLSATEPRNDGSKKLSSGLESS